jgi:hypothetical protein
VDPVLPARDEHHVVTAQFTPAIESVQRSVGDAHGGILARAGTPTGVGFPDDVARAGRGYRE